MSIAQEFPPTSVPGWAPTSPASSPPCAAAADRAEARGVRRTPRLAVEPFLGPTPIAWRGQRNSIAERVLGLPKEVRP
ncbi:hypothetical protein ACFY9S_38395 [Streptomyces sp. NPDC012474]|uniref:hypothetical protein n=1 Tax=Streptomyces sp. NPDC012474 TaxID=3364836 RepID=UPI0036E01ACA